MNSRLLERFLRYIQIDTTADPTTTDYPSSTNQFELGKLLVDELNQIGLADVSQDENGIVTATLPGNTGKDTPAIGFCSHMDTSPESPGANIKPQIIENYPGGPITLDAGDGEPARVITPDESPALDKLVGKTIITTDGTTLLGADDKAGIAIIIEAVQRMVEQPEMPHGPIRVCFTCDEEIGRGVDKINVEDLGIVACYTLDGEGHDLIDVETFSADCATVTVHGVNIHPSIAKDRMTNAIRVAARLIERIPVEQGPESTDGRVGFLHPYQLSGGVEKTEFKVLLRSFETPELADQAAMLKKIAAEVNAEFPAAKIDVDVQKQYRNMRDGLGKEPRAVKLAVEALKRLGREPKEEIVRGGTDGSRLTELGLPTPNLSCGGHTPHSRLEWACLEEMESSVEWITAIAAAWAEEV
ncbi:MAG: peptidase T [Planctomycetia bacterium]|jgi:tripeptide aminopeptidase